ncbi:ribonuclease HI [Candidatus Stoquefichus sp. KLE1796]|nr:ribonuclease HI [Candidatus Stoquefichus sp. KLE1796]
MEVLKMSKFYAVKQGRQTGIFSSWKECEAQVKGFKGAIYKSFASKEEALTFLDESPVVSSADGLIAYVDGSYNIKTKEYGYGCVLLEGQNVIAKYNGKGHHLAYVSMRNVAGEIAGARCAIDYAIEHHYPMICIYYDYEGIEKWANKMWKANKEGTIAYQKFIEEARQHIDIVFIKVLAHSGDFYNEMADGLAKKAVGIQ